MIKQDIIQFSGNNVPISEVAKIMKKDKQFVRIGIQEKWLPIGVAYRKEGSSEYSYYVSPKKLYEYTGYNESIQIQMIPIYNLEPNTRITLYNEESDISGDYIISNISIPFDINGTMTISANKALEKI